MYNTKKIYFTGSELFWLKNSKETKLLVSEKDGNLIQREFNEWDEDQKNEYLTSVLKRFPHNPFHFIKYKEHFHVVDGQHRLSCILDNMNNNTNLSENISKHLFECIIINLSSESSEESLIELGSQVFEILNNKQDKVKVGSLWKTALRGIDRKKTSQMTDAYKAAFKWTKSSAGENIVKDEVYDILGVAMLLMSKKSDDQIGKIKTINTEVSKYLDKSIGVMTVLDRLIAAITILKKNGEFGNKANSAKQKPQKNILVPLIYLADKHGEEFIKKEKCLSKKIHELRTSDIWKESKKNTRSPDSYMYTIKAMSKGDDAIEWFEKENMKTKK